LHDFDFQAYPHQALVGLAALWSIFPEKRIEDGHNHPAKKM
jgi:hypothetical protein